ncbi:MAG: glycosyltransferase [Ignavibacteria bacterium]|nr:glycosyltransferase [Ignavibacteria bacterium]MDH7527483.1 glycosyltransferase [Ignavibacteria bacterium]
MNDFNLLSRAKRQVKTLLKNNFEVIIFQGNFNNKFEAQKNNHINLRIRQTKCSLLNFFFLVIFNFNVFFRILKRNDIEIVFCRELSTLLSGYLIKIFNKKIKLVYDSNELSIETYQGIRKKIWYFLEKIFVKKCDLIIHAEKNRKEYFNQIYPFVSANQIVQPNFVEFNPSTITNRNNISAIYIGAIGPHRDLEKLLQAFAEIKEIKLVIKGFGSESYINQLKKLYLKNGNEKNISFEPPINDEKLNDYLKNFSIGIAFYPNTNLNNWFCAPNKVYQYLQNNLAIITSNNPPLVELIDNYKVGCYIKEISKENLISAINTIINNKLWNNITEDVKKTFSWETLEPEFIDTIKNL